MKKISLFLALLLATFLVSGQNNFYPSQRLSITNGMVAYFPFNGNANDESGNGNNPNYIGPGVTLTSDRFGNPDKAYYFNGNAGSYIRMPADRFPTTDRTISFWFNAEQIENQPTPLSYGGDVCYNSFLMIINKGDYPNAYTVLSHCASNFISAPYPEAPVNKWYYLTMTISGATQKIFINGILQQTSNTFSTPTVVTGKSVILGALLFTDGNTVYVDPTAGYFKGKLDDFRFYDVAMNDSEVQSLFNNEADGLVAYYPFNKNANDESGNGHNGSVSGATITTDRFNQAGKAYNFVYNGFSSDKIQVSGTSDLNFSTGGFSIGAWVKFSGIATGGYNYPIFSKHICGEQSGFILMLYNGKLTFWLAGSGGYNVVGTSDDYTDNSWHQVVAVYDGSTQYIYVDGVLKNSVPITYNSFNSANWALGGYNGCNGGFNGKVDEIKVFSQALTGVEIQDMYKKSANDLVVFLPFNGDAKDESGNGHDGTVNGGVLTSDRNGNLNSAYTFPTSPDQIVLSNSSNLNLLGGFTLNAWIKYKNLESHIISKHNCYTINSFALAIYGSQVELFLGDGGTWSTVATDETFTENQWYMVSAVYDSVNKTASIFINGLLKASGPVNYTTTNNAPITISGATGSCPAINYTGAIDEVKIYDKPLNSGEILSEYYASQTGLVAYYPFSGNADDASGNMNKGVTNNTVLTNDRFGIADKAFAFNGIDSYIEGTNPGNNLPTGNSSRTFAAWVKDYKYQQWGSNIFHYGTAQPAPTNFHFLITDVLGLGNGYGYGVTYGKTNLVDSAWHFVCGTYNNTNQIIKLYVDGRPDNSEALSNPPNTVLLTNWRIGLFMVGGTPFNGKLDEIRVLNTVLSDQDILDLYMNETTAPILQNPVNQSSVNTLTPEMSWSSILANAEFRFQLASDSLFGTTLHDLVTTDLITQLPDALLTEGQNYYWRVRTTLNGETGPWSPVWSFDYVNTRIDKPNSEVISLWISPNPADASSKIRYSIPASNGGKSLVTLELVNSIGIVKASKRLQNQAPGNYEISIDTSDLEAGIYFCRLKTRTNQTISKMVVIH